MTQKLHGEKYMLQYSVNCLTAENIRLKEELAPTQDTIRIALKTAGYQNVDSMNQFERASALLDMAQELAALTDTRKHYESVFDKIGREIANVRKRGEAHGGQ